jgi:hypothetical protein
VTDFIVDASVAVKWVIAEAEADRAVALGFKLNRGLGIGGRGVIREMLLN